MEIHPDDAARLGPGAGHAGAGLDGARLRHPARARQSRPAAGHAVRAHPLVGREQLRAAASARWCSRQPIPSPASPKPRRRRRASPRFPCRTTASPCRASRCGRAGLAYWAAARATFGHVLNFALDAPAEGWRAWLSRDTARGRSRELRGCRRRHLSRGVLRDGRLEAMLFVGPERRSCLRPNGSSRSSTVPAFTRRAARAAGRPTAREADADEGPIVCVCFQVGAARIAAAAAGGRSHASRRSARRLGAGTNCGSCIPEIRRLHCAQGDGRCLQPRGAACRCPPATPQPFVRAAWSRWRRCRCSSSSTAGASSSPAAARRRRGRPSCCPPPAPRSRCGPQIPAPRWRRSPPSRPRGPVRAARAAHGRRPTSTARPSSSARPRTRTRPPASSTPPQAPACPSTSSTSRLLHLPVRRHRQPLAAGRRHLHRRRGAGVRPGHPLAHRGAAAGGLRALGRGRQGWRDDARTPASSARPCAGASGSAFAALALAAPDRAPSGTGPRRAAGESVTHAAAAVPRGPRHARRRRARRSGAADAQGRARAALGRRHPVRRPGGARDPRLRPPRGQAHAGRQDRAIAPPASRTTSTR